MVKKLRDRLTRWFWRHWYGVRLNEPPVIAITPAISQAITASAKGFFNPPAALAQSFFKHTHPFEVHHWHAEGFGADKRFWCCWCGRCTPITPERGVPVDYLRQEAWGGHEPRERCNINHETGKLRTIEAAQRRPAFGPWTMDDSAPDVKTRPQ